MNRTTTTPSKLALVAAFASIYLVWGSTYLAIVIAIHTMPPLLMLGARFGFAGLLVYGWCRYRGIPNPTWTQVRHAALVGTMTLAVGTGLVAWAEQWVPSGVAALLATSTPLWMVLLDWKWKGAARPDVNVFWGMALGLTGIALLANPAQLAGGGPLVLGMLAIVGATVMFATGAILGRDLELPEHSLMSTATQMTAGGLVLTVVGSLTGEWNGLVLSDISVGSWLAWAYLMVFGSIVAYGSFVWLMKTVPSSQVATHAYVNPIVAVLLGWMFAGEVIEERMVYAIVLLLSAVVLISRFGGPRRVVLGGGAGRMPISTRWIPRSTHGVIQAFAGSLDRPAMSLPRPIRDMVRDGVESLGRRSGTR